VKRNLTWYFASFLSKPYLYVGNSPRRNPTSLVARFRLETAINLYLIDYNRKKDSAALFFIAKCFQSLENFEEALNYFKKVWEVSPFNQILFKEICTTCLKMADYEEGLRFALKEVSQFPNNPESKANLAYFLLKNNREDDAIRVSNEAYEMDKTNEYVIRVYNLIRNNKTNISRGNDEKL